VAWFGYICHISNGEGHVSLPLVRYYLPTCLLVLGKGGGDIQQGSSKSQELVIMVGYVQLTVQMI
jgi:hypothetical protein